MQYGEVSSSFISPLVHIFTFSYTLAGSATSSNLITQLAHLAGLKVAAVVDQAKHGLWMSEPSAARPDMLLDSHDPQRAVAIIRSTLGDGLRFGIDTRGKESAAHLLQCLQGKRPDTYSSPSPPSTPSRCSVRHVHLVGLTGLPQADAEVGINTHTVPIKLFHEVPAIGEALCTWMERLLAADCLCPPRIIGQHFGLGDVNNALDKMRRGEVSGGKMVVTV